MAFSQPIVSGGSITHLEPGFKFIPTDEEIIMCYLHPRALNQPLPSAIIVDVDILSRNPWDLIPEGTMEMYFFSHRVPRGPHGNRCNRAAGDGHWRASGKDVPVFCNSINAGLSLMVGLKKTLVFYHGKAGGGQNTEWVMQEYSLVGAGLTPYPVMMPNGRKNLTQSSSKAQGITKKNDDQSEAFCINVASLAKIPVMLNPDDSWVVCRIYKKKKRMPRATRRCYSTADGGHVSFFDFLEQGNVEGTTCSNSLSELPLEKAKDDKECRTSITENASNSELGR